MKKYPLKLTYTAKTALWAGKRLKEEFGKKSEFDTVSESWELSVRDDEMAKICNGEAEGLTLREYFDACGYSCVTPSFGKDDRFPLLVKLIDAADILSVQVHPDDSYAYAYEGGDSGKTEMWYIIDALPNARLVYGLRDGVSKEDFASAVAEKRLDEVMNYVDVKKGQTYFIPAGMVHAIGAGILIAEIQQNSDLTYRVYDFDRVGADGKLRPLHVEKSIAVTRPFDDSEIDAIRYARGKADGVGELLANSEYFKVQRLILDGEAKLAVGEESFMSVLCLEGGVELFANGEAYTVCKGDSYFLPAGMGEFSVKGNATLILSEVR